MKEITKENEKLLKRINEKGLKLERLDEEGLKRAKSFYLKRLEGFVQRGPSKKISVQTIKDLDAFDEIAKYLEIMQTGFPKRAILPEAHFENMDNPLENILIKQSVGPYSISIDEELENEGVIKLRPTYHYFKARALKAIEAEYMAFENWQEVMRLNPYKEITKIIMRNTYLRAAEIFKRYERVYVRISTLVDEVQGIKS